MFAILGWSEGYTILPLSMLQSTSHGNENPPLCGQAGGTVAGPWPGPAVRLSVGVTESLLVYSPHEHSNLDSPGSDN
jgi:hypothetical protein